MFCYVPNIGIICACIDDSVSHTYVTLGTNLSCLIFRTLVQLMLLLVVTRRSLSNGQHMNKIPMTVHLNIYSFSLQSEPTSILIELCRDALCVHVALS